MQGLQDQLAAVIAPDIVCEQKSAQPVEVNDMIDLAAIKTHQNPMVQVTDGSCLPSMLTRQPPHNLLISHAKPFHWIMRADLGEYPQ